MELHGRRIEELEFPALAFVPIDIVLTTNTESFWSSVGVPVLQKLFTTCYESRQIS